MQSPTDLVFGGYGPSNPKRKEESFDVGYWNPPCERSPMSPIPDVLEVPPPLVRCPQKVVEQHPPSFMPSHLGSPQISKSQILIN